MVGPLAMAVEVVLALEVLAAVAAAVGLLHLDGRHPRVVDAHGDPGGGVGRAGSAGGGRPGGGGGPAHHPATQHLQSSRAGLGLGLGSRHDIGGTVTFVESRASFTAGGDATKNG